VYNTLGREIAMKCLLIETKDKRKFLTEEKNFKQLIEFSNTFGAKMSIVEIEEGEVLKLEELAPAICNSHYEKQTINYEPIKEFGSKKTNKVIRYIENRFKKGQTVSLQDLKNKFKELTPSSLCNYVTKTKKEMESLGVKFVKIGAGKYRKID
jgi:hypothetical protein